jgi:hypothetical protein
MKKEGVGSSIDYPLATGPLWLSLRTRLKGKWKCRRVIKTWRSLSVESFERLPECCIQWIPFHGWLIKEMELSLSRLDFFFFFFLFLFDKGLYWLMFACCGLLISLHTTLEAFHAFSPLQRRPQVTQYEEKMTQSELNGNGWGRMQDTGYKCK